MNRAAEKIRCGYSEAELDCGNAANVVCVDHNDVLRVICTEHYKSLSAIDFVSGVWAVSEEGWLRGEFRALSLRHPDDLRY